MGRHTVYRLFESALPVELCDLLMRQGAELSLTQAALRPDDGEDFHDHSIRETRVAFWDPSHWVSGLLVHFASLANRETWNYRISLSQGVQYGEYGVGGKYDWHKDEFDQPFGDEAPIQWQGLSRKLSVVGVLSDPGDYSGGELRFKDTYGREVSDPALQAAVGRRGSIVVFPAYIPHTVSPVTEGKRCSIVSWIIGPPFV